MNGSSITGRCSNFTNSGGTLNCTDPTSSVLFDGHIPTLTGLDGDMWASQLLALMPTGATTEITFDFRGNPNLMSVEVVMFNCLQWGVGVQIIAAREDMVGIGNTNRSDIDASCDYLVTTCTVAPFSSETVTLRFTLLANSYWIHLAEVTFHTDTSDCPPDTTVTGEITLATTSSLRENTSATTATPTATIPPLPATATIPPLPVTATTTPLPATATTSPLPVTATTSPSPTITPGTGSIAVSNPTTENETVTQSDTTLETDLSRTTEVPVNIIIAISVVLLLLLVVAVAAFIVLFCWRHKHHKEDASHTSTQAINLREVGNNHEEQAHTSLHTQRNDEEVSENASDDPEYSVVATKLPVFEAELIESENHSDHFYDRVDGKRKEKARTQQQALPFEDEDHLYDEVDKKKVFAHPKSETEKKNRERKKSSPPKTDYHDEDHDSTLQEGQLYALVDKSGKKKNHAQESPKLAASQGNWLYQDNEHDLIAVTKQVTSEDHSYDRVEWNVGKAKESATSECQFHNKLEEGSGAASKEKVEPLQREDSEYDQVDMSSTSFAEAPEEYFHLRHHEKSVPYLEENALLPASGSEQDDMYAQLEESNVREVPRQQTAPHTTTQRSQTQDHLYGEPEGEQSTKFPRKHTAPHGKSHHHLYTDVEEKKVRPNQTGPPPVTPPQNDLYSQIEERKVQTKSASLLRKSRDDRFTQPEEREARTQTTPSDQPQDHLYAQPDKKNVQTKSSSLLSKSHDNLYAQPEERDVHTHLTSFASRDRLRKSHDHLYAELEEGKGNKASKELMSRASIKSGKHQSHEYAELKESAQLSSLSSQTSRASLKSKKPQVYVYAQLEEGEMHAQPSSLPPEELLYTEPEERRVTKKRSTVPHAQPKGKQHAHLYSQVEERRAAKKRSTLSPLKCGKPHARLYSQVEERDMQTQLSSLPPEELFYAKLEKRKATKKCSTLPPLRGGKPQTHLYAQLEERGASKVRATPPTTPVSSTPSSHLYAQLEERETSGVRVGQSTTSLETAWQSHDDLHTQLEEEDTSDIRSTPPPAM